MSSQTELFPPGTLVTYWGNAANGKYYGQQFTIMWANECGCRHQTYSIRQVEGESVLSQALADSLRVVES